MITDFQKRFGLGFCLERNVLFRLTVRSSIYTVPAPRAGGMATITFLQAYGI